MNKRRGAYEGWLVALVTGSAVGRDTPCLHTIFHVAKERSLCSAEKTKHWSYYQELQRPIATNSVKVVFHRKVSLCSYIIMLIRFLNV